MASDESPPSHSVEAMPADAVKHLEFIQSVIGRLGNNGFFVKGWAITVAGLFFGFAVESDDWRLGLASSIPLLAFWGVDAYFLRAERLFRQLYKLVAERDDQIPPFYMAATSDHFQSRCDADVSSYWRTFSRRPALWGFYGALLASGGLVVLLIVATPSGDEMGGASSASSPATDSTAVSPTSNPTATSPTVSSRGTPP